MTAFYDLVYQRTKETGTGSLPLTAVTDKSYRTFQEAANTAGDDPTVAEAFWAYIRNPNAADEWEISRCHLDGNGHLVRDRVYRSATGSLIDFSEGSKVVTTEIPAQLFPEADYVVYDGPSLEDAIGKLSDGETIRLLPGTFRTSQWLDITADDVTIRGAGRQNTIIKPDDGSHVGGFHVGIRDGDQANGVLIEDLGVHGNTNGMTDGVSEGVARLHGFDVENAKDCTLRNVYATRTHPYHIHDDGGSGISVGRQAEDTLIVDPLVEDPGDRCIQIGGFNTQVRGGTLRDGFDRGVSLNYKSDDGTRYPAHGAIVDGVLIRDLSEGSGIAAANPSTGLVGGQIVISDCVVRGEHRNGILLGNGLVMGGHDHILIQNCTLWQETTPTGTQDYNGIRIQNVKDVVVVGCTIRGSYNQSAIYLALDPDNSSGLFDSDDPEDTPGPHTIIGCHADGVTKLFEFGLAKEGLFAWGNTLDGQGESYGIDDLQMVPVDLTSKSDDPSEVRYYHHDGSGSPAAGLYRSDPANSQYVRVEDNTVTIAY